MKTIADTILWLLDRSHNRSREDRRHYLTVGIAALRAFPNDPDLQHAAFLHDMVEDTYQTLNDLRAEGYNERVVELVDALTHRSTESYDDYIDRIPKGGVSAINLKMLDVRENLARSLGTNRAKEMRYRQALVKLSKSLGAL